MNRLIVLGLAATFGAANLAMRTALADPPVDLQAITPGVPQVGHINISGTVTSKVVRAESVFGNSTATTGIASGGDFRTASTSGRGFYALASATTGLTYGGFFQNASSTGRAVYGLATDTSGVNYGGYFQSASTSGRGILGVAAAATGTTYGVYGKAVSPTGYGVYSYGNMGFYGLLTGQLAQFVTTDNNQVLFAQNLSTLTDSTAIKAIVTASSGATIGGTFYSLSVSGRGVYAYGGATGVVGESLDTGVRGKANSRGVKGEATATSGTNYGVWGETASTGGIGTFGYATASSGQNFGVYGHSVSTGGRGVYGVASASSGFNIGVWGVSNSPQGFGVYGENTATTGITQGVYGVAHTSEGFGVYGHNSNGYGVFGTSYSYGGVYGRNYSGGDGVYGVSNTGHGVVGLALSDSPDAYGVFCIGNLAVLGNKQFRIDHPTDPQNKYLLHYATESPSPQNFYVGNVTTDSLGYAWVELPSYFADINKNFKYQLTIVDDADGEGFVQVKVSKKVQKNRFQIRTSAPHTEVSWRVDADRNDLFMRKYPAQDVVEKDEKNRGKYQMPELYNLGPEFAERYDPTINKPRSVPPAAEASSRSRKK